MNGIGDGRDIEPQDGGRTPANPNESPNAAGNQRATRNITVSIQYSYFTPHRLANLNNPREASANDPRANLAGFGGGAPNENVDRASDPRDASGSGSGNDAAAAAAAATAARPDGALVLSFRDVPISTPQERLESIISIAAELAMRRFSDIMSLPKGITREQFEQLPVLQVRNLPEKEDAICSICYENYEDEPSTVLKRARDGEDEDNEVDMDSVKKRRSESPGSPQTMETAPSHVNSYHEGSGSTDEPQGPSPEGETSQKYIHSPIELPCGHVFGRECLDKWSQMENSCPLCRRKIVDTQPEQSPEPSNGNGTTNMEAFERIRQLLYNSPAEQRSSAQGGGTEQERTRSTDTNGVAEELDPQSFTISRSGIVFLRPGPQPSAMTPNEVPILSNTGGDDTSTTSAPAAEEAPAAEQAPTAGSNSNDNSEQSNANSNRRIHWMPLPLTSIRMDTGFANQEGQDQHDRLAAILDHIFNAARNDNTQENSARPNTGAVIALPAVRPPVTTIPGPASFSRAAINHTAQAPPEPSTSTATAAGPNNRNVAPIVPTAPIIPVNHAPPAAGAAPVSIPATASEPTVAPTSSPPRRRSFLDNILRITNLNRTFGRSRNNNNNSSNDNSNRQPNNTTMFNSGVASYRNHSGRVSTFPIHNSPLPSLPLLLRRRQGSNRNNNNNANNTNSNNASDSTPPYGNQDAPS